MAETLIKTVPSIARTPPELEREPLVRNQRSLGWISDHIAGVAEGKTPRWWWYAFIPASLITVVCISMVVYLMSTGVGVWGLMIPVAGRGTSRISCSGSASATPAR